jgi:Zn-finger nucleic acid-binding protein
MNCPVCENELSEMVVDNITVDICKGGCGGIWFDHKELDKFDEPHEAAGESLLDVEKDENLKVDHDKRRECPRCSDKIIMMRHFSSVKREIEVDECPKCGGNWLDTGELLRMRNAFRTDKEKDKAAGKYFAEVFGTELKETREESGKKLARARKFAHMLRFICPSYYIPGKQDWGAF